MTSPATRRPTGRFTIHQSGRGLGEGSPQMSPVGGSVLHYAENPHGSSLGLRLPAAGRSSKAHSGFLVHELDGGCCITLGQLLGGQHGIEESLAALRRIAQGPLRTAQGSSVQD